MKSMIRDGFVIGSTHLTWHLKIFYKNFASLDYEKVNLSQSNNLN